MLTGVECWCELLYSSVLRSTRLGQGFNSVVRSAVNACLRCGSAGIALVHVNGANLTRVALRLRVGFRVCCTRGLYFVSVVLR